MGQHNLNRIFKPRHIAVSAMKERHYPVFICWMGGKRIGKAVEVLNEEGDLA